MADYESVLRCWAVSSTGRYAAMCTDDSDYSVVCGPRRQIESMIEQWTWFETGWPYGGRWPALS